MISNGQYRHIKKNPDRTNSALMQMRWFVVQTRIQKSNHLKRTRKSGDRGGRLTGTNGGRSQRSEEAGNRLAHPCCTTAEARGIFQRRHGAGRWGSPFEVETAGELEIRMDFSVSTARFTPPTRRGRACAARRASDGEGAFQIVGGPVAAVGDRERGEG